MEAPPDFKELLALFNAHKVEYVIVGGYALAYHGAPRYTGDIDLFVDPSPENAQRVLDALDESGFGDVGLDASDFQTPEQVVQLGYPPVRIDLITSIAGVPWELAEAGKVAGSFGDVPVFFIGRREFVANKRSAGRKRDLADLDALGEE